MMRILRLLAPLALAATLLNACATRPPIPADAVEQPFELERDLVGANVAHGEFRSITGERRTFVAYLNGALDGEVLTLVEDFEFADGERDRKTWRLERTAPGHYVGTREDVVGEAIGYQDGAAFRLEYDVVLANQNGEGRRVRFRDVLALDANGDVINRATVGWRGLRVASVSLLISRTEPLENEPSEANEAAP